MENEEVKQEETVTESTPVQEVVEEKANPIQEAKEEIREVFQKHALSFKDKYSETGILIYADLHKLLSQAVTLLYQVNE